MIEFKKINTYLNKCCIYACMFAVRFVVPLQTGTGHFRRLFLNAVEVRGTRGWPILWIILELQFHVQGLAQKTDENVWGVGDRHGVGCARERTGSDEPQPKRKTHCFSSTGWEGGNSQLCRHNTSMNVRVGCEVQSCSDWQTGEKGKEMPLPPSYLTAQDRMEDSRGTVTERGKLNRIKRWQKSAAFMLLHPQHTRDWFQQKAKIIFFTSFHKNTNQLCHYSNDGHAVLHFYFRSLPFPICWNCLPLAAIVMTLPTYTGLEVSCGQSCGERLTLQD